MTVLDLNLRLLRGAFTDWEHHEWRSQIDHRLSEMLSLLSQYDRVVEDFGKGYLIRREHAMLRDGAQVVYSMKIDGQWEFPGRKKQLTSAQLSDLRDLLSQRLVQDKA